MKQLIVEIDEDRYMMQGESVADDVRKALVGSSIPAIVYDMNETIVEEMLDMLRETNSRLAEMKGDLKNIDVEHIDNILLGTSELIEKAAGRKRD